MIFRFSRVFCGSEVHFLCSVHANHQDRQELNGPAGARTGRPDASSQRRVTRSVRQRGSWRTTQAVRMNVLGAWVADDVASGAWVADDAASGAWVVREADEIQVHDVVGE